MAFGKRNAGDPPPRPPVMDTVEVDGDGVAAVRTVVSNPGGIDRGFIALAAGVVILSAGVAMAAPSLLSVFGGGMRPIKEVVADLDRQQVRAALALEAFPDEDGRAFMTSLATHYPKSHGKLLDALADQAMVGAERDELYVAMNMWSVGFVPDVMPAVSRTGAEGFDKAVGLLNEGLHLVESEAGGCTARKLQTLVTAPDGMEKLTRYGGKAYHFGMRTNHELVELAAKGRNLRATDTRLTANDMNALQSTFFSLIADPQVSSLMMAAANGGMGGMDSIDMQNHVMDTLNLCQLGRAVTIKLEKLPSETKARIWGTLLSGDASRFVSGEPFSMPLDGASFRDFGGASLFRP